MPTQISSNINRQKQHTRSALLEAGMEIMFEKGYHHTGIQEVLSHLSVPKGSFYHYFKSKEEFGLAIIDYFDCLKSDNLVISLQNKQLTPLDRLRRYCEDEREKVRSMQCRKGCLIGNLSQEMADQSETIRQALAAVMIKWQNLIADCLAEGQALGEIRSAPANELAELFLSSWEGAIMRSKTTKSITALDTFIQLMFDLILPTPDHEQKGELP